MGDLSCHFWHSNQDMSDAPPTKRSTADLQVSQFHAHGVVDIWQDGSLIHYRATGPFNAELIDLLAIAQRDFLLAAKPSGAWGRICTVVGSAMTSPDAIARYTALMAAPKPPHMVPAVTAFVVGPEVEGNRIMATHYRRIFQEIGRPFQIFETLEEATAWVSSYLSSPSP